MPQLDSQFTEQAPGMGFPYCFGQNDQSATSRIYLETLLTELKRDSRKSEFFSGKARFAEARRRLAASRSLRAGWDTYDAEAPNRLAIELAGRILDALELEMLPPTHLIPSAEGGIAMSFVKGARRAEIEIYNTGEVAAATYSAKTEPLVWELDITDSALKALKTAIEDFRVHFAG